MKILEVADRPGWAVERLSRPVSEMYDNVDIAYFNITTDRYLDTGYGKKEGNVNFTPELASQYDIVHFHEPRAAVLYKGHIKEGVRKIVTKHTEREEDIDWNFFDDIVCSTKYVYQQMLSKKLRSRIWLVPMGIDLKKYQFEFKDPEVGTIGFVGRVMPHKRFDVLHKACIDGKLKLIGTGYVEDSRVFRRWNGYQGGAYDYIFTTMLPEVQMPNFYSRCQILVCLSEPHIETGPLPVLEAMACGIPVLSTRVGWAKDCAEHGKSIWFIDENEIGTLGSLLRNICRRPDILTKLRNNGMRLVSNFGLDKYCQNLMKIYET